MPLIIATSLDPIILPANFDPSTIPGLDVWLRGDSGVGLTGAVVSSWTSKVGANVWTSGVAGSPTFGTGSNGRETLIFNGTAASLRNSAYRRAQSFTMAIAFKQNAWTSAVRMFDGYSNTEALINQFSASAQLSVFAGTEASSSGAADVGKYASLIADYAGTGSSLQINGGPVYVGSAGTNGFITGMTIGSAFGGLGQWFNGEIQEILIWSRLLRASEKAQVNTYLSARYSVKRLWTNNTQCLGDSLTFGAGVPASQAWPVVAATITGAKFGTYRNRGVSGFTVAQVNSAAASDGTDHFAIDQSYDRTIETVWCGTNDIANGRTDAQVIADLTTLITNRRNAAIGGPPLKVIVGTTISRGIAVSPSPWTNQMETYRLSVNNTLRTPANVGADLCADIADSVLGPTNAWQNTTYYQSDEIHLTQVGYAHAAGIWAAQILAL